MPTIGEAARRTGTKIPTIRFYEQEGLLRAPPRAENGRRVYAEADIRRLSFIRHARALGFELDDVRSLLTLTDQPAGSCMEVDAIARSHLGMIEQRIAQLTALKLELTRIAQSCAGGGAVQECRVVEALTDHGLCRSGHQLPSSVRCNIRQSTL